MWSAQHLYDIWSKTATTPFLHLLRAYYRTGQLDEKDHFYVLLAGGLNVVDGHLTLLEPIDSPTFDVQRAVRLQGPAFDIIWRIFKWQLQYTRYIAAAGEVQPFREFLHRFGTIEMNLQQRINELLQAAPRYKTGDDFWRRAIASDHTFGILAYAMARRFLVEGRAIGSAYVREFLGSTEPREPISNAYWQYLIACADTFIMSGQIFITTDQVSTGHPLLAPVVAVIQLPLEMGGESLTGLSAMVAEYSARGPTYPEAMSRLVAFAKAQP